ncbi:MAG: hypothetical protein ABIQ32_03105 [Sphingomicrobium sp.]
MRVVGLLALAALFALGITEARAQEAPSQQARIAQEIDKYLNAPRSAATYRALARMGDPTFFAPGPEYRSEYDSPLLKALDLPFTSCRWSYSDQVYRARIQRLGENHPYVRQWLRVQKAVFSRCHGYERTAGLPIPAPLSLAAEELVRLQAEDRAYQTAAAAFYDGRNTEARSQFATIARKAGEHQAAAKLMVAAIDAGSSGSRCGPAKANPAMIKEAERLLNDPAAKTRQADVHELIGWIGATVDSLPTRKAQVKVTLEALALPLEVIRADPQARARFDRAAEDLPRLFTDFDSTDWWLTGAVPEGYFGSEAMAAAAKTNRLVAFALTRPAGEGGAGGTWKVRQAAEERFGDDQADRDAWRVAVLRLGPSYAWKQLEWKEIDALIARVGSSPTDHDVALLGFLFDYKIKQAFAGPSDLDSNARERAVGIQKLAAYPYKEGEHFQRLYSHALNSLILFKDIASARRLRDLVEPTQTWAVDRDLLLLLAEDEAAMIKVINDHEASESTLLNRLPSAELMKLSMDGRLQSNVRKRFARVAWTRTYVLGKRVPKPFDQAMRTLNPAVASGWTSQPGARSSDHSLLLDVLNTPGMNLRIESRADPEVSPRDMDYYEHSLNNWWCSPDAVEQAGREEDELANSVEQTPRGTLEALLAKSYVWQALDREEREALSDVAKGPQFLSDAAIRWAARASARRPKGADEALALAVRATRYGCQMQGGHGAYSHAAWTLLHSKFPDSDAAKRTRWWFDCKHFTYGCSDAAPDENINDKMTAIDAAIDKAVTDPR